MGFVVVTPSMAAPLEGPKRWAYLAREKTIRVASLNESGSIHLSSMWYVVRNETIYIPVDGPGEHAANFEAKRAITALVDSGDEYTTACSVRIEGTAAPVSDSALFEELQNLVFEKYFYPGHPYSDPYFQLGQTVGRKYYALVPSEIVAVDMRETASPPAVESHLLPKSATDRRI